MKKFIFYLMFICMIVSCANNDMHVYEVIIDGTGEYYLPWGDLATVKQDIKFKDLGTYNDSLITKLVIKKTNEYNDSLRISSLLRTYYANDGDDMINQCQKAAIQQIIGQTVYIVTIKESLLNHDDNINFEVLKDKYKDYISIHTVYDGSSINAALQTSESYDRIIKQIKY